MRSRLDSRVCYAMRTMTDRATLVAQELSRTLGHDVGPLDLSPTGGGCINTASVIDIGGTELFVKWNDHPLSHQFAAEAAGLAAMADSGTSLRIPKPIAWSDDGPGRSFLVVEYLSAGQRVPDFEVALGYGLAEMHRCTTQEGFGFSMDGYCGATPQPNGWMKRWIDFYRNRRIGHQIRLARKRGMVRSDIATLESVMDRFEELLADDEPPALIHGDLWGGNLHVAPNGSPALIDPAAYYGHREAELGMMVLFGGFGRKVFEAYDEAYALREGWRERLELYSLYHVLNHFNLFGGGYGSQAVGIARRYA